MYLQTPQLLQDGSMNKNNFMAILKVGRYPEIVVFLLTVCVTASRTGLAYTGTCLGLRIVEDYPGMYASEISHGIPLSIWV